MNHLGRNLHRRFAGDKNDSSPVALLHARKMMPAEPHPAHHIDLEKPQPIRIRDFLERLRLKDTEIVDQNIDVRKLLDGLAYAVSRAQVSGKSFGKTATALPAQLRQTLVNPPPRAPVDNDRSALQRQPFRDG